MSNVQSVGGSGCHRNVDGTIVKSSVSTLATDMLRNNPLHLVRTGSKSVSIGDITRNLPSCALFYYSRFFCCCLNGVNIFKSSISKRKKMVTANFWRKDLKCFWTLFIPGGNLIYCRALITKTLHGQISNKKRKLLTI